MGKNSFVLDKIRFAINSDNIIYFTGWYRDDNPDGRELKVYLGNQLLDVNYEINRSLMVRRRYLFQEANVGEEIIGCIDLPERWAEASGLKFAEVYQGKETVLFRKSISYLKKRQTELCYDIESEQWEGGKIIIKGWALPEDAEFRLLQGATEIPCTVERSFKANVLEVFVDAPQAAKAGFDLVADVPQQTDLTLVMQSQNRKATYSIAVGKHSKFKKVTHKGVQYLNDNGYKAAWKRGLIWLDRQKHLKRYEKWRQSQILTEDQIKEQRDTKFDYNPKFSIVVPLYNTQHDLLREMIDSVLGQTYGNLELCMADGTGADSSLTPILEEYREKNDRVIYKTLLSNDGISENTNRALELATGDFIVLVDHDDTIPPDALFECVKVLNQNPEVDVIYSDEDKMDESGTIFFEPHLKSDFNPEMLRSMNYICHLFVAKKSLIDSVGHFRKEYDGSQDFDIILRCCEGAQQIYHIPKVLYHWRCNINSTASHPESKMYAYEAGKRAIHDHYLRCGIDVTVDNTQFGRYKSSFQRESQPLVTVIITDMNNRADAVLQCIRNIHVLCSYSNLEFVVAAPHEINTTEIPCQISFVNCEPGEGLYARYNRCIAKSNGEYLLFADSTIEIISEDSLNELLDYAKLPGIGAVGTRINCKNELIWNAGYVLGMKGTVGNAFMGAFRFDPGYFCRAESLQDYSAVSGMFLMISKENFDACGGFCEEYQNYFGDVDLCLRLQEHKLRNVMNPYAEVYYTGEETPKVFASIQKSSKYKIDEQVFLKRWEAKLPKNDPHYNVNLALDSTEFLVGR